MELSTVKVLLQYVMLSIPAIGVYMQTQYKAESSDHDDNRLNRGTELMAYQLGRASILLHLIAGGSLILQLLAVQPPQLLSDKVGQILLVIVSYGTLFAIAFGMYFFGSAATYDETYLAPRPTIKSAIKRDIRNRLRGCL